MQHRHGVVRLFAKTVSNTSAASQGISRVNIYNNPNMRAMMLSSRCSAWSSDRCWRRSSISGGERCLSSFAAVRASGCLGSRSGIQDSACTYTIPGRGKSSGMSSVKSRKTGCSLRSQVMHGGYEYTTTAPATFEPQLDPLPALAFGFVFAAYIGVQLVVRRAINARERREQLEADVKDARLQQLGGKVSAEEVQDLEGQLKRAVTTEVSAAEIVVLNGLRLRVRVPRPIGTPLEDLITYEEPSAEKDDNAPSRDSPSKERSSRGETKKDEGQTQQPGLLGELSRDTTTTLALAVSVLLIWSLLGLSSDPMADAPQWLEEMGQASK